jgi:hypothetical protein
LYRYKAALEEGPLANRAAHRAGADEAGGGGGGGGGGTHGAHYGRTVSGGGGGGGVPGAEEPPPEAEAEAVVVGAKRKVNVHLVEVKVHDFPFIFHVSVEDVAPGEELLTVYGCEYWEQVREGRRSVKALMPSVVGLYKLNPDDP